MSAPPHYPPPPGQPFYPPRMPPPGFPGAPGMPPRPYGAPGMPPPGPWPGGPPPPGFPQAPPPPNTSVYVGKISPLVDDDLMRAVLETCGELRSWKRSTDPETGAQKRFGFADFASPDGVLRALRVLREFPLAGSELLLNVSQATQKFLDFHTAQLKSRGRATIVAAPQLSNPPAEGAAPEPGSAAAEAAAEAAEDAAADKAAVGAIQELVLQRLGSVQDIAGKLEAVQQAEPQQRLPPPPPLPPPPAMPQRDGGPAAATPAADADSFLATLDGSRESDEERAKRLARERERDKERRERERREELRREERAAVDRERALERAEAERERERAREAEREREARRARQRDLERDLEEGGFSDSDGARRHALKRRRDAKLRDDRRRRRARELEDDEADRRREEQEALLAARKRELAAERAARAPPKEATPPPVPPPPPPPAAEHAMHVDARAAESSPEHAAAEAQLAKSADEAGPLASAPSLGVGLGFRKRAPAKKVVALNASIFGEEEAVPQKRTLVPIEYTEEELRAALVNEYAAAEGTEAGEGQKKTERDSRKRRDTAERDAKKSLLSLIDSIPTSRAELFAHPVDWAIFDSLRLADTVSRWAAKKVAELLGEAEPSLVEFVTAQTSAHCAPDALLTELQDVLDDEAEAFVVKLWRLIIFETLKNKSG